MPVDAAGFPDIGAVPLDLAPPPMTGAPPAPGTRVRVTASGCEGTGVHHSLYLPSDWRQGGRYPVIVEYAGNGPYRDHHGDTCSGKVEDCSLGYGISGGTRFIWACLPCVSDDHRCNQLQWWGDVRATVAYCKSAVPEICRQYGGDSSAVFIAGFSRGSIACNYIGLHDDDIAALWRGFICHSHYDGLRTWGYPEDDRGAAVRRLRRLHKRPQFISSESSIAPTERFLREFSPEGSFTFQTIPYRNHTDTWVLRDIPERRAVRAWLGEVLGEDGRRLH